MTSATLDVVGIGNAIVDVLTQADEAFLQAHQLIKGTMSLIDSATAEKLYARMNPAVESSGGSVANTMAGIASLGGRGAYIGKIKEDALGQIFRHDIQNIGVKFETPAHTSGPPTARCLIFVTPDAARTMATYLGACVELTPDDVNPNFIRSAKVTYLEGYLWDPPHAKQAMLKAARLAQEAGREVALTLSDPFCVDRHRDEFNKLIDDHVDILFANEHEIISLCQVETFDQAVQDIRGRCGVAVLTRSEKGAVIVSNKETQTVPAEPVSHLVDTTGAGDLFAAGFLYGYTRGKPLPLCGRMGAIAAAEVISHFGPRPQVRLATLLAEKLGKAA